MKAPSGTDPGPRIPVPLGLVLPMVFWGSAFVTSKLIVFEVPPDGGAVLRFGLGAVLMMGLLFLRAARPFPPPTCGEGSRRWES
jgi:drug/metabolite transporter (DMT)-like permease